LGTAKAEHQVLHGAQAADAEFEADGEHQEDDTEFGQPFDGVRFGEELEAVRAEGDADQQVGEQGRQAETVCQKNGHDRRGQKQQDDKQLVLQHGFTIGFLP